MEQGSIKKKVSPIPFIIGGVVLVAAIAAAVILLVLSSSPERKYQRYLDQGEKYLSEMEYEDAVAAFKMAIEIDPSRPEAYEGLAEAYVGLEKYEKAVKILEEGAEECDNDKLLSKSEKIRRKWLEEDVELTPPKPTETVKEEKPTEAPTPTPEPQYSKEDQAFMKKVYDLMSVGDYESMCSVDGSDESTALYEKMKSDKVLYAEGAIRDDYTGKAAGLYCVEGGYYFFYGDVVDGVRSGKGSSFWVNGEGYYETFEGEWKNDAPNGKGTEKQFAPDYNYVKKGEYVNGLENGHISMDVVWYNVSKPVSMSYDANMGDAPLALPHEELKNYYYSEGDTQSCYDRIMEDIDSGKDIFVISQEGAYYWYDKENSYLGALGFRSK